MVRLDGKVAFVTGAARGQGRSFAVRLAAAGADIIAIDICADIASVRDPLGTAEELARTAAEVEAAGSRIFTAQADVRDEAGLRRALGAGTTELGPVDIVIANAGIAPMALDEAHEAWQDVIDVNLTGVFNTIEICIPQMVDRGAGGAVIIISSAAGLAGIGGPSRAAVAYTAAKHGTVGLMRTYANNLAPHRIRVNTVHPTGVRTPMVVNDTLRRYLEARSGVRTSAGNALPVDMIEPEDVADAVLWLVSDHARYVTGVALPVDAGFVNNK